MLIINAKINTMDDDNTFINNGYIKISNGKIEEIGDMPCDILDGCVIDALGCECFPGFIDSHTHLGVINDTIGAVGEDFNESSRSATPEVSALDGCNFFDGYFEDAAQAGITTVVVSPGSSNVVGGKIFALKTFGKTTMDRIVNGYLGMKFALGENPKKHGKSRGEYPFTRMASASILRERLMIAQRYISFKELDDTLFDYKLEPFIDLLERRVKAHVHAHRADDILTALRIAQEFSLDIVIVHATGGQAVTNELVSSGSAVIYGPIIADRSKPELCDLTPKTPGVLSANGIMTAITTDHPEVPIQYLPISAGIAVAHGMERQDAIRGITANAAKVAGIFDRVGSLQVGKDADILLFDGDPFSVYVKPKTVIISGEIYSIGEDA